MFIGHYGVSFAIKKKKPQIPLWLLFVAVQFVDILFFLFVLLGIEDLRIVPGFTVYNPYDLYKMPYTHSLLGNFVWAIAFGAGTAFLYRKTPKINSKQWALWLGLAVFSHFLLDFPMHTPDLPLMPGSDIKFGLGLWNYLYPSLAAEILVFGAGLLWFGVSRKPMKFWIFIGACSFFIFLAPFMPIPQSTTECAVSALFAYALLAGMAAWAVPNK